MALRSGPPIPTARAPDAPRRLRLNAESLTPGMAPACEVSAGAATTIATGAMIPRGADAVVMVEWTECPESGNR